MAIGAAIQASSYTVAQLIVGRIVSGLGMGAINSTVPVLQAEISPKAGRGRFVCAQLSTLNFGILISYWLDFGMSNVQGGVAWRFPVAFQGVFIILLAILLLFAPESPRWLIYHGRTEDATKIISRLKNKEIDHADVRQQVMEIEDAVQLERLSKVGSWKDLFKRDAIRSRRRLAIACAIQAFQQLNGINAVIYYSNTLFQNVGFSNHESGLMAGYLQTWFFVASFIPWFLIDRFGRRPLLIYCVGGMAAVMAVQAALIYQVQNQTSSAYGAGIGGAAMLFLFEGLFTVGFQATVWVYPSEILPLAIRQKGSSLSTASNWIFNFLVVKITPTAIQNIGWKTYIIFAVLNAFFVPCFVLFFPETKGKSLEEVDLLFIRKGSDAAVAVEEKHRAEHIDHIEQGSAGSDAQSEKRM